MREDGEREWIASPSALADFDACPTLGKLRHGERLGAGGESESQELGRKVHEMLAKWWRKEKVEPEGKLLEAVMRKYEGAYGSLRERLRVLAIEQPLVLADGRFGGVPDLVALDGRRLLVIDHKTTGGYITGLWQEKWAHSEQLASYLDLVEAGVEIPKDVENPSELEIVAVVDAIQCRVGSLKVELGWYEFSYDSSLRIELRRMRWRKVKKAIRVVEGEEEPVKITGSCVRFNRLCEMAPICFAKPEMREAVKERLLGSGLLVSRGEQTLGREE